MLKILYDSTILTNMKKFMFTKENVLNGYKYKNGIVKANVEAGAANVEEACVEACAEKVEACAANVEASAALEDATACIAELDAYMGAEDKKNLYTHLIIKVINYFGVFILYSTAMKIMN